MKDTMRTVYQETKDGWVKVETCQSFEHACRVARELQEQTKINHCVNS